MMRTITIEYKTYNKLIKSLQYWGKYNIPGNMPYIFILGSKDSRVINGIRQIPKSAYNGGCFQIPRIEGKIICKYSIKLIKKGYVIMGIARVGSFSHSSEHNLSGVWKDPIWKHKKWVFLGIEARGISDPRQNIKLKIIKEK